MNWKYFLSLIFVGAISSQGIVIDGVEYDPVSDRTEVLEARTNTWNNPTVYYGDSLTIKKSGSTFSVADWIPNNLVDVYVQSLVHYGATSKGMLDGPGYMFNDTNGILPALSTNWTWMNPGYRNYIASTNEGGDGPTPISQWKMNDNAGNTTVTDSVGANNGTAQRNTSVLATTGKINGALTFAQVAEVGGDYIDTSATVGSLGLTGAVPKSICMWVKMPSFYWNKSHLLRLGGSGTRNTFGLLVDGSGYLVIGLYADDPVTSFQLIQNQWHHVALTYDGTNVVAYMDGVGDAPLAKALNTTDANLDIGVWFPDGFNCPFNGQLDDVRIYNSALSSNEIASIYNSGNGTEDAGGTTIYTTNTLTLACTNKVLDFVPTATWMSILASGSGLTTNDVQGYVSPDYGANWYQATLEASQSIDLSNTLFQGSAIYTNNVDSSNMVLKAVATSNKVVKILGMWGPSSN